MATQIAPHVWNKLSDADKKMFVEVTREAAARGSQMVAKRESELVAEFKAKGVNVIEVNKDDFKNNIVQKISMESMGYRKADWDAIQAVK